MVCQRSDCDRDRPTLVLRKKFVKNHVITLSFHVDILILHIAVFIELGVTKTTMHIQLADLS